MEGPGLSGYRWVTLLLATSVQVGVSVLQQAPAALGPILSRALELSNAQIGLLSAAIGAGMLVTMLPIGMMIERWGEKTVMLCGVAMMAVTVAVNSRASTFLALFFLLLLASFGSPTSFRDLFKNPVGTSPRDYRRAFGDPSVR